MLARREAGGGRRMWLPCLLPQSSLGEVVGRGGRKRRLRARARETNNLSYILYPVIDRAAAAAAAASLVSACLPACACAMERYG